MKIDSDVLEVLNNSNITGNSLALPLGLARPLYMKVNKVIELAGGKWDKKSKGHVFPGDPRAKLGMAVETGEILDTKKELQAFYTPLAIAEDLVMIAGVGTGMVVLEPSAGAGAIAISAKKAGAKVTCIDIDAEAWGKLKAAGLDATCEDFLLIKPYANFDAIIMNPPFTKGQDAKHVMHAFKFLKPGGKLVAIVSPTFKTNSRKPYPEFKAFVEENGRIVKELPAGTFKESGTNVRTVIIELTK